VNELEAKYLVAAGRKPRRVLEHVLQTLSWAGYRARLRSERLVVDTYFDTPDWALQRAGWAYRLREDEQKKTRTLAVKAIKTGHYGVFRREEFEQSLDAPLNRPGDPPAGQVADQLWVIVTEEASLKPLFHLRNQRTKYDITSDAYPGGTVELSLDRVTVDEAPGCGYTELELELLEGPEDILNDIVEMLNQQSDIFLARVGKYQRGLLASGRPPSLPSAEPTPSPDKECRWLDLGLYNLRCELDDIRRYEPHAWESIHPEGVHQMRVATRRARAALRAFGDVLPPKAAKRLTRDIRWLTSSLGPLRDLDVQIAHIDAERERLDARDASAQALYRKHLEKKRRRAHRRLVEALASDEYRKLIADFERLLEASASYHGPNRLMTIREAAHTQMKPQLDRLLARGRNARKRPASRRLHRLRIALKRLRYQLEYLEGSYGKPMGNLTRAMEDVQDSLGNHQDAMVAVAQLERFRRKGGLKSGSRKSVKRLIAAEQENAARYRKRFRKDWRKFEEAAAKMVKRL
jgi:CHAD domain-containing protein